MSLSKQYSQTKPICRITFKLVKKAANSANRVNLVGDFNAWDTEALPMKKLKSGDFTVSLNLEKDREYQFRYLVNGQQWVNDNKADKYVSNVYKSENSVVVV